MALRVGIDLVQVDAIEASLRSHGEHYLRRVYTEREVEDCRGDSGLSAPSLAARFAAKEAALKALQVPPDRAIPFRSIELVRDPAGWTTLELSGPAAALAAELGVTSLAVSISHEDRAATAVVVAELPS
ncbi:MAG TPA: holo-ACP synthase [Gaiellaceae bacterium]|nr:holo-ACP synthase [Gaiellaceae bacterium]